MHDQEDQIDYERIREGVDYMTSGVIEANAGTSTAIISQAVGGYDSIESDMYSQIPEYQEGLTEATNLMLSNDRFWEGLTLAGIAVALDGVRRIHRANEIRRELRNYREE